jgi:hypothetical protein
MKKLLLYHPYQLSSTQRIFLTSYFAVGSFCNPEKGDFIAGLADATGYFLIKFFFSPVHLWNNVKLLAIIIIIIIIIGNYIHE